MGLGEATFRLKEPASELLEGKPGLIDRKLGLGEATFRLKEPASGLLEKTPDLSDRILALWDTKPGR
ncbi:hypothetical protein FACS1894172_16240 [Spirochaetia bacterium]|nr:hypothetical protein FACS1894172_16240 [Spirochaetia bacterium]